MVRRLVLAAIAVAAGLPAWADDGPNIGPRTLQVFPQGEERCYRAQFDNLKPGQILQSLQLYRLLRPNPAKEAIERSAEDEIAFDKKSDAVNWAQVVVKLKGHDGLFDQSLSCYDGEGGTHLRCGVECDGGSFLLNTAGSGVTIRFEDGNGLSLNQSCGDPDDSGRGRWLTDREAGVSFTLATQTADACIADDAAARPGFAADPTPLRERIGPGKWTCLSRSYDKAHLAKHPKQLVTDIALAVEDAPSVTTGEYDMRNTVFGAELSVALRNGKTAKRRVQCMADDYQFRCGGAFRLRRNDDKTAMLVLGEYGGEETERPTTLNDLKIGSDDLVFRLDGGTARNCMVR